jgi:hypothetical protein
MRYYIWHDNQVKTSDDWDDVLSYGGGYVMDVTIGKLMGRSFGYILPGKHQWMSISPGDIPKAFKLGLMLMDMHV